MHKTYDKTATNKMHPYNHMIYRVILVLCLPVPSGPLVFLETINHAVLCHKMAPTEQ